MVSAAESSADGAAMGRRPSKIRERWHQAQEVAAQLQQVRAQLVEASRGAPQEAKPQEPDSVWTLAKWLQTIQCTAVLAKALREPAKKSAATDLLLLRTLATHGSRELVLQLLTAGMVLERLADAIWEQATALSTEAGLSTQLHVKFEQEPDNLDFSYSHLSSFFGGLEALVGAPSSHIFDALETEHCKEADSDIPWTSAHGITSAPKIEWNFVMNAKSRRKWPKEQKFMDRGDLANCREAKDFKDFEQVRAGINKKLELLGEDQLTREEVIGVRLYTGPMFEKYNAVCRGGSLLVNQPEGTSNRFQELCKGNHYATTVHTISSALTKLSKLQMPQTVYRGIAGGLLPSAIWQKGHLGISGGIELGFLSTTLDLDIAKGDTVSSQDKAAAVLEIQTGTFDRGADISMFSQYPQEKEICFAPLTIIEVQVIRQQGPLLLVQARLNVHVITMEQMISRRHKLVGGMCASLELETLEAISRLPLGEEMDRVLREEYVLKGSNSLQEYVKNRFKAIVQQSSEAIDDDRRLMGAIKDAIAIRSFSFVDCTALQWLSRRGTEAAACSALVIQRVTAAEPGVFDAAVWALKQMQVRMSDQQAVDAVIAKSRHHDRMVRQHAIHALGAVVEKGNREAIQAVIACLDDECRDVRSSAVEALETLAEKGDRQAFEMVLPRLEHQDAEVRLAALTALRKIVGKGDCSACSAVIARLKDDSALVRREALRAMEAIAEKGEQPALAALVACLEDPEWVIRKCALDTLETMSDRGNQQAMAAAISCLEDKESGVRGSALSALKAIAEKGNQDAIIAVTACLRDRAEEVRKEALGVLVAIAEKGDQHATSAVVGRLEEEGSARARVAAMRALERIAAPADQQVVRALTARLKDSSVCWCRDEDGVKKKEKVSHIAQKALSALAPEPPEPQKLVARSRQEGDPPAWRGARPEGDRQDVKAALARLEHEDADVRLAAVGALKKLAGKGSRKVADATIACLQDCSWPVRREALRTLEATVEKGSQQAIEAVIPCLEDYEWMVRKCALDTLEAIAGRGHQQAKAAVIGRLEDQDVGVRGGALDTLKAIAETGDQQAIAAVIARFSDGKEEIRKKALETVAVMAEKGDQKAITAVLASLEEDGYARARIAAMRALETMAERGDPRVVAALHARLQDDATVWLRDEDGPRRKEKISQLAQRALAALAAGPD